VKDILTKKFRKPHTRLIWVRVTSSFSRNSNSTPKVVILKLWTTSNRLWQIEGTSTRRLPELLPGVGTNSTAVVPTQGNSLKWMMLIFSSVVNKKFCRTSHITF
jgi:hypothetical protein